MRFSGAEKSWAIAITPSASAKVIR